MYAYTVVYCTSEPSVEGIHWGILPNPTYDGRLTGFEMEMN